MSLKRHHWVIITVVAFLFLTVVNATSQNVSVVEAEVDFVVPEADPSILDAITVDPYWGYDCHPTNTVISFGAQGHEGGRKNAYISLPDSGDGIDSIKAYVTPRCSTDGHSYRDDAYDVTATWHMEGTSLVYDFAGKFLQTCSGSINDHNACLRYQQIDDTNFVFLSKSRPNGALGTLPGLYTSETGAMAYFKHDVVSKGCSKTIFDSLTVIDLDGEELTDTVWVGATISTLGADCGNPIPTSTPTATPTTMPTSTPTNTSVPPTWTPTATSTPVPTNTPTSTPAPGQERAYFRIPYREAEIGSTIRMEIITENNPGEVCWLEPEGLTVDGNASDDTLNLYWIHLGDGQYAFCTNGGGFVEMTVDHCESNSIDAYNETPEIHQGGTEIFGIGSRCGPYQLDASAPDDVEVDDTFYLLFTPSRGVDLGFHPSTWHVPSNMEIGIASNTLNMVDNNGTVTVDGFGHIEVTMTSDECGIVQGIDNNWVTTNQIEICPKIEYSLYLPTILKP